MPTQAAVLAVFFAGRSAVDFAVREVCRRPDQYFFDVPSHVALIVPRQRSNGHYIDLRCIGYSEDFRRRVQEAADLYEMTAQGWSRRDILPTDLAWAYPVIVPDIQATSAWCKNNAGRYRWWVDALILVMDRNWIRHCRVPALLRRWHIAVRHICSVDAAKALSAGGWTSPHWFSGQDCPISPNDLLFAVRGIPATLPEALTTHA